MGHLYYGAQNPIEIPDRILAHLRVVATTKLRRNESFTLTWRHPGSEAGGRTSLWIQPAIPLRFDFESDDSEQLDQKYLQSMADAAYTTAGLVLDWTDEPVRLKALTPPQPVAAA